MITNKMIFDKTAKVCKEISTHIAIQTKSDNKIQIWVKGLDIPGNEIDGEEGIHYEPEYLYSIPAYRRDDLFAIFEDLEETNRCNLTEANGQY